MGRIAGRLVVYLPADLPPGIRVAGRPLIDRFAALGRSLGLHVDCLGSGCRDAASERPVSPASAGEGRAVGACTFDPCGPVLLVAADAVFVAALARRMLAAFPRPSLASFADGAPALVCIPGTWIEGQLPESLLHVVRGERWRATVPLLAPSAPSEPMALDEEPRVFSLRRCSSGPAAPEGVSPMSQDIRWNVVDPATIRTAETALLESLQNPRDGLFDRVLNRRVSKRLTAWLLPTRLTPNQVTIWSLAIGALGALAISADGRWWPLVGALLFQLSAVLDCVDGEIARARFEESEWGEWLDISADTLTHILIFGGIAGHVLPEVGARVAWTLASAFALGGLAAFGVVTWAERTEDRWQTLPDRRARWLAGLLRALTTRDLSVLVLAAAAAGLLRELLYGAAVGAHVFWVVVLMLLRGLLARANEVAGAEQRRLAA